MILSPVASRIDGVSRFAREHGWHLMSQDRLGFAHPFDWEGDGVVATIRSDRRCRPACPRRHAPRQSNLDNKTGV